jgi:hypothetical protein
LRYLRLKSRLFGVLWSNALGGVMRSVVKHVTFYVKYPIKLDTN